MVALRTADLFCGAGGTSIGAYMADPASIDISFAVNHWDIAIKTHSANFPKAKHIEKSLGWVRPGEAERINLLFASPECTHHSNARGGRPTTDQQRAGAWELMPWLEYHRPSFMVVENVVEFEDWGPVDPRTGQPYPSMKGKSFQSWVHAIESVGYRVEYRRLNAADFGAATSRTRMFVVARRGNRRFHWPEPTHTRHSEGMLPGFDDVQPWRGAIEIIDWSIPLPSVFARKRPLADKTLARIEKGLDRHVAPMIVTLRRNCDASDPNNPIGTVTADGRHHGVAVPFVATVNHGDSGGSRTKDIGRPLGASTSRRGDALAVPMVVQFDNGSGTRVPRSADAPTYALTAKAGQAVAVPLIMAPQSGGVAKSIGNPVPVVTTMASSHLIVPWITSFYGTQNTSTVDKPCPTIVTKERHAATSASIGPYALPEPRNAAERQLQDKMAALGVFDIGFRMLSNEELAAAQGFPSDYQFAGNKKQVTRQIGNSVSPPVAQAITEALLGS